MVHGEAGAAESIESPRLVREVARLESVFEAVPAAIALLEGPEHRFVLANRGYRELVGGRPVLGLSIAEALPEVTEQGFVALLDGVVATGQPYYGAETPVMLDLEGRGELSEVFVNFVYLPMRAGGGAVEGVLVHAVNVTELVWARRRTEALAERLAAERHQLETVIDQMPAGVVIAEVPSGRLVAANRLWRDFFAVELDAVGAVESYGLFSATRPDGREYRPEDYPLARSVATGEVVVGERLVLRRADGVLRTIEVNSAPILSDGRIEAGVATFFDVSEQIRSAKLIEDNKSVLELVAAGAPLERTLTELARMIELQVGSGVFASVLLLDRDGVHLRHGAAPSLPDPYNAAIDGLEIGPAVGSCGTAAFTGAPVVVSDIEVDPLWDDFRALAREHALRACWSSPILSPAGAVLGTFALYRSEPHDPTPDEQTLVDLATRTAAIAIEREQLAVREREAREEAERRANAALSLEHVMDGVCLVDTAGVVQIWNPAAARITGAAAVAVVGRRLADVLPAFADAVADLPAAIPGSAGREAPAVPVTLDRRELWLSLAATPFPGGVVCTFRDRTADRRLEQVRAEITATVSHELRTPLAAVFGAAQTLGRPEVMAAPALRDQFLEMIATETRRLTRVVDQILLANETDEEHDPVPTAPVEVGAVVRRAVALFRARAEAIELVERIDDGVRAFADADRLQQIVANLLDNALKYGAVGGRVEVEVSADGSAALLLVRDFGVGVPLAEVQRIFDRFYRLDPEQRQGIAGTGLGLYICRQFVLEMGGAIWVEPTPGGRGATFVVELRAATR